jgi:type IV pilus assembly protein PilC
MADFAFGATDRVGNTVEGRVAAEDVTMAAAQVRELGYTPEWIEPVVAAVAAPAMEPTQPLAAAVAEAPRHVGALDLTQPWGEPVAEPALAASHAAYGNAGGAVSMQPWERGGPIAPAPAAPDLNSAAAYEQPSPMAPAGSDPTQPMAAGAGNGRPATPPPGVEARPGVRPPYAAGVTRPSDVVERFKEVFIYPIRSGVVIKDLSAFYRQFATLIDAGLPLFQAMVALEANTQNGKLKEIARAGQLQIQAGGRFSDVMAAYPWIFPEMQVQMIRAAEHGGMLDQMLRQVADYVDHEISIRRLIKYETFYPKLVIFFAVMILGRPGFFEITPAFSLLILGSMGKGAYTFSNYLADTVGFALMALVPIFTAVVVFRLFLFNVKGVREAYDSFKTSIPGLGGIVRMFVLAKFMRVYAALYKAGFGVSSTLQIAGDACGNVLLRNAAQRAIPHVERGGLVSESLSRSGFFPPMAVDMFRTGETTGGMDQLLDKMADHYEAEAKTKAHQMALIFSAVVFLTVAFLVGMAVIRFYTGMGSSISNASAENG